MSPVHVEKDTSLIAWSRVHWLVSRGSDGKKLISIAGMLGDMLWGAVAPLVYCGCLSVAPECSLVYCSGIDDEE